MGDCAFSFWGPTVPEVNFKAVSQAFQAIGADRLERVRSPDTFQTSVEAAPQVPGEAVPAPSTFMTLNLGIGQDLPNQSDLDAINARKPYGGSLGGDTRIGFVLTSDLWRREGTDRAILLHAGPASASWTLALRASEEDTKGGRSRHAQARGTTPNFGNVNNAYLRTQTFWDFPRVNFEFQSGNIMPIPLLLDEVAIPHGLDDFYLFLDLLNQPPLMPDGDDEGKHNYVWIFYTSLQFPQIVLKGYFDPGGVSWQDTSEDASRFTWSADFVVHESSPNLWERDELKTSYENFMKANAKVF